ncbi:MAG: glycosyltransferase family 4 protein [Hylemonella sp.]
MKLLHVVRRYGPVGGMERYVWELTQALARIGYEVEVLCEVCVAPAPPGVRVHELGAVMPRPRWLALLRFGHRVRRWVQAHPAGTWLIHSHERLGCHDFTTFHGPPFATIFQKSWLRWLSLRVAMHLFLEMRELMVARAIVPVSDVVARQLAHYYPWVAHKITRPVVPAVGPAAVRPWRTVPSGAGVVGFVGREWKRKGLPVAIEAVKALRALRPGVQLVVVGPEPAEIAHLLKDGDESCRLVAWTAQVPYADFDVLIHPAQAEPFGMVVTEAMAARVPVVVSAVCGAAREISSAHGEILPVDAPPEQWARALDRQLSRSVPVPQYRRSWAAIGVEYGLIYALPLFQPAAGASSLAPLR